MTYMCDCVANSGTSDLSVWVPAIVSIVSVLLNIVFSVFIAPRVLRKSNAREKMHKICTEYQKYLSSVVSFESFDGVPTEIRRFSLEVLLMFKSGKAPEGLTSSMEAVYQAAKRRKHLAPAEITAWEQEFREKVDTLRREMAKYSGVF